MFQLLKAIPTALIVLIFCFFISALVSDEGQKSQSQLSTGSKGSRFVQLKKGAAVVGPNIQIHPTTTSRQFELSIATHPSNPDLVLVAGMASQGTGLPSLSWYSTTDGGVTWSGADTFPTHADLNKIMADPAAGIDLNGSFFVAGLYPSLTPSANVIVARSTDGGANWVQKDLAEPGQADRTHLTIDVNPGSPYENYIYVASSPSNLGLRPVYFSRSTDGGQTFSSQTAISGSIGTDWQVFVNLAVGPDSVLYATWSGFDAPQPGPIRLAFNRSTNGGASWDTAVGILTISGIGPTLDKGPNCIVARSAPSMAIDRSTGPRKGTIYIVYPEVNPTTPDIFLIHSTDAGGSWSSPQKVNQDTSNKDQWFPWISVDPATGDLYVVYYDSRNFPNNDSAQVYISSSTDGGQTFQDILVSDVPFLPVVVSAFAPACYMGSYIGISALNGIAWPCWMDNRTGIYQAYTSKVVYDSITVPPKISVWPNPLDFGAVIINQPETLTVKVRNLGYPDTLEVTNISSDTSVFTPELSSFSLPGASYRTVKVVFSPPSDTGKVLGTLTIANSDTTNPNATVSLRGKRLCSSKPGDVNGDNNVNLTDIIGLVNHVFKGAAAPVPSCKGNVNGVSPINLSDVIYLVNRVFKSGPLPVKTNVCCL